MARPRKEQHEKRSTPMQFRATVAEQEYIRAQAETAGIKPSEYLRRRALGYEVVAKAQLSANAALVSELNRIGVNVNQLARSVHRDSAFQEYWREIGVELNTLLAKVAAHHDP